MENCNEVVTAETILTNAMGPQSVTADGLTVTARSTKDQLDALAAADANRIAKRKRRGMVFSRITPGSAVGESR